MKLVFLYFASSFFCLVLPILSIKCFKSCSKNSSSAHFTPSCTSCLTDCNYSPKLNMLYNRHRHILRQLKFKYVESKEKVSWKWKTPPKTNRFQNITVTLYEWPIRAQKAFTIKGCCAVPVEKKRCSVKISQGSSLFWALNINGTQTSSSYAMYTRPVEEEHVYDCSDKKMDGQSTCLAVKKSNSKTLVLYYQELEATSLVEKRTHRVENEICLFAVEQETAANLGKHAPNLTRYFDVDITEISYTPEVGDLIKCDSAVPLRGFWKEFAARRDKSNCFSYLSEATSRPYFYCAMPRKILASSKAADDGPLEEPSIPVLVVGVVAGVFALVLLILFVAFRVKKRRSHSISRGDSRNQDKRKNLDRRSGEDVFSKSSGEKLDNGKKVSPRSIPS